MVAVKIHEVDGEAHAEGMHGLTGEYPQALAGSELRSAEQAFPAVLAFIGKFRATGKDSLARDIRDPQAGLRFCRGALEQIEDAGRYPARPFHEIVFCPLWQLSTSIHLAVILRRCSDYGGLSCFPHRSNQVPRRALY
jgi:hypothetical protein